MDDRGRAGNSTPSKNYAMFRLAGHERVYMVESISAEPVSARPKRSDGYEPSGGIDALADAISSAAASAPEQRAELTIKVHGFNVPREVFARELAHDVTPPASHAGEEFLPKQGFLIGYRWPSEGMLSGLSIEDLLRSLQASPAITLLMLLLPLHGLLVAGTLERLVAAMPAWVVAFVRCGTEWVRGVEHTAIEAIRVASPPAATFLHGLFGPYTAELSAAIWLGAGLLMLLLRLSTYQRDRYRAIHYGAPDLGEFVRDLERALVARKTRVRLNVLAHSMGSLLVVNAFRVMSEYFHGDGDEFGYLGRDRTFKLGTLILCAPDLPAVMATHDRNNYFQSALRRFESLHVFSSDRDLILKWLSPIVNWASEPRYDMVGRKLGNVLLLKSKRVQIAPPDSRSDWTLLPTNRAVVRPFPLYTSDPLGASAPALVHFHDCTLDPGLGGSYGAMVTASVVVMTILNVWALRTESPTIDWLAAVATSWLVLGLIARPLWPYVRDTGRFGGVVGAFAEVPSLMMFATYWRGWDPHGGYFAFGRAPRQRIRAILMDAKAYPKRDALDREIEEEDGPIRYRSVRISV